MSLQMHTYLMYKYSRWLQPPEVHGNLTNRLLAFIFKLSGGSAAARSFLHTLLIVTRMSPTYNISQSLCPNVTSRTSIAGAAR